MLGKHYHADPSESTISKFWVNVEKTETCWLWTGGKIHPGYGQFYDGQRNVVAHRFSYAIHTGDIPEGMCVLHSCDVPACVNPEHLRLGTYADNVRDMAQKGRHRSMTVGNRLTPPKGPKRRTAEETFDFSYRVSNAGCWIWTGTQNGNGYGRMTAGGRKVYPHRYAYERFVGPIPEGLFLHHTCNNGQCVNPAHLVVCTQQDNLREMGRAGRQWLQTNPDGQRGTRNNSAKLNEEQVREIRRRYAGGGVTQKVLSKEYGVSERAVVFILQRKHWAHVPD